MVEPFLDSIAVDGSVQSTEGFIGSGAQLTDIPQHATLNGFMPNPGGNVNSTDTIQSGMEKLEYKVNHIQWAASGDSNYVHTQIIATNTWVIQHNLHKYPSVTVIDSNNYVVIGDITYDSVDQVTIIFTAIFSGRAILN